MGRGLTYYGGKGNGTGKWIAQMLPHVYDCHYVEPFAGMLGVLNQRPRSRLETVNDLNGRVANWWRVVRDFPNDLAHKVKYAERGEQLFNESLDVLDEGSPVDRALAFYVVIQFGIMHGDKDGRSNFARIKKGGSMARLCEYDIFALADRLQNVQVLNEDALQVVKRFAHMDDAVMYLDPPYAEADTEPYSVNDVNHAELIDVLKDCKGRIAISGYGEEWDALGWNRRPRSTKTTMGSHITGEATQRTEVLWTNYKISRTLF